MKFLKVFCIIAILASAFSASASEFQISGHSGENGWGSNSRKEEHIMSAREKALLNATQICSTSVVRTSEFTDLVDSDLYWIRVESYADFRCVLE